jgi:hypothetical protein
MQTLNNAYFFVIDKIIDLQTFFWNEAWAIGRIVLLIALISAAVNYAISGAGLKDNLVKIGKALVFFVLIMSVYPRIIGHITHWTFSKAQASTYSSIAKYMEEAKETIAAATPEGNTRETYAAQITKSEKLDDPSKYFSSLLTARKYGKIEYTVVAPAAAMELILLIAGECLTFSDNASEKGLVGDIGKVILGLLCAFFVIFAGVLSVLEYLMAFLEYMFITSVGIILFPLSLWEGTKFMAEKLIGAIMGFFIKLLFCNICIFLMLYGFISLANGYTQKPFTGQPDEIVTLIFICLLFFFLSKSAPALAQSLLTGTPSLTASGVIGAAKGAVAGAAAAMGVAKMAGGAAAGGMAKVAFGGAGAIAQAAGAASGVKILDGSGKQQAGAFMASLGGSAKNAVMSSGGDLVRSLLGKGGHGGGGSGGAGAGLNRHSQRQKFLDEKNDDGTKKTFKEYLAGRMDAGIDAGQDRMFEKEKKANASSS